jgi:hypothetical protein
LVVVNQTQYLILMVDQQVEQMVRQNQDLFLEDSLHNQVTLVQKDLETMVVHQTQVGPLTEELAEAGQALQERRQQERVMEENQEEMEKT